MWREARGWGVHCRQQTVHSRQEVSLHTHEERDEVSYLLEAARQIHVGSQKNSVMQIFLEKRRVGTLKRFQNSQFGFIRLDDSQVSTQLSVPAHSHDSLDDGNIFFFYL